MMSNEAREELTKMRCAWRKASPEVRLEFVVWLGRAGDARDVLVKTAPEISTVQTMGSPLPRIPPRPSTMVSIDEMHIEGPFK